MVIRIVRIAKWRPASGMSGMVALFSMGNVTVAGGRRMRRAADGDEARLFQLAARVTDANDSCSAVAADIEGVFGCHRRASADKWTTPGAPRRP